jgi:hypothetical protein
MEQFYEQRKSKLDPINIMLNKGKAQPRLSHKSGKATIGIQNK